MCPMNDDILDSPQFDNQKGKPFLSLLLFIAASMEWYLLKVAVELPYDDNYGALILAFIISLGAVVFIGVIWWKYRTVFYQNRYGIFLYLLTSSPMTVIFVITNYQSIFGGTFRV